MCCETLNYLPPQTPDTATPAFGERESESASGKANPHLYKCSLTVRSHRCSWREERRVIQGVMRNLYVNRIPKSGTCLWSVFHLIVESSSASSVTLISFQFMQFIHLLFVFPPAPWTPEAGMSQKHRKWEERGGGVQNKGWGGKEATNRGC